MYLMRAEAKYRMGDAGAAAADVNAVRQARNPGWASIALTNIDQILEERGFFVYYNLL